MFRVVEDRAEFVLVDKAPDVSFHRDGDGIGLLGEVKKVMGREELYPVHRLDKMTSGLVVFAKTPAANRELSMAFQARQTEKYYLALSRLAPKKKPKKKQGLIKGDMERSRRGAWKLLPTQQNPAITQFFSVGLGEGVRLFVLKPHTGKTHQLRVALKSIGAPILGDPLYSDNDLNIDADRGYLHAYCLGFSLGECDYRFVCEPRQGACFQTAPFVNALESFAQPWSLPWPSL